MLAFSAAPDPPEDAPDLVGTTLSGGWQVVRHIALGSMGHVYEAKHSDDGPARAAVKVLHTELVHNHEVAFRFRREAEILEAIESPHVPRIFDRGRDPKGRSFFVLELVSGRELFAILNEQKTLSLGVALEIARQLCLAMEAAHKAGIIHRDLKPENVMIAGPLDSPTVKVLDFSVSKVDDIAFTQAGTLLGTPSYMPPEQALGREITPKVDVYAVGAILYDMLCGRPPFDEGEPGRTLGALLTLEAPAPRALSPDLPEEVEAVILRAIAKAPEKRYPSIGALAGEIGLLLGGLSGLRVRAPAMAPATDDDRETSIPDGWSDGTLPGTALAPPARAAAWLVAGVIAMLVIVTIIAAGWLFSR